eukprot:6894371-Prymnesium_polylepis.1
MQAPFSFTAQSFTALRWTNYRGSSGQHTDPPTSWITRLSERVTFGGEWHYFGVVPPHTHHTDGH